MISKRAILAGVPALLAAGLFAADFFMAARGLLAGVAIRGMFMSSLC
jgi:hypothetical protein